MRREQEVEWGDIIFSLKCCQPIKQRGHLQRSVDHQNSHVIHRRSQDRCIIHKCTQRSRRAKYFGGNGTSSAPHPCPNRQFNSGRHHKLTSPTKTHKTHGHAIPLAARSRRQPKTIPILLAPRDITAGGLLDETSLPLPSPPNKR